MGITTKALFSRQHKLSFPLTISSVICLNPQGTVYLVILTENILDGKLHLWCSVGFYKSNKIYFRNVDIVVTLEKNSWI